MKSNIGIALLAALLGQPSVDEMREMFWAGDAKERKSCLDQFLVELDDSIKNQEWTEVGRLCQALENIIGKDEMQNLVGSANAAFASRFRRNVDHLRNDDGALNRLVRSKCPDEISAVGGEPNEQDIANGDTCDCPGCQRRRARQHGEQAADCDDPLHEAVRKEIEKRFPGASVKVTTLG